MKDSNLSPGPARDGIGEPSVPADLAAAEELFRNFFDNAPIGKSVTSPDGRLLRINPAFCNLLGYSAEEIQNLSFAAITHPDDLAESRECIRLLLAGEREVYQMEKRYLHKDGREIWTRVTTRLQRDASSRPIHFLTHIHDITENKRAEEKLQLQRIYLRQIIDAIPAFICVKTNEGRYEMGNQTLADAYGTTTVLLEGKSDADFGPTPEECAAFLQDDLQVINDRQTKQIPAEPITYADGSVHWLTTIKKPLLDSDGGCTRLLAVALDITERVQAEEQLKKALANVQRSNKELEQFAYVASHDLQEPLRMVASYTQLLAQRYEGQLDDKAKKYIHYAVDGAVRMQRLINDLLAYSRVSTRGVAPEPTDAHAALGEALVNLQAALAEAGAIVTNDDLPTVHADAGQLAQVFQNLVGNAIKFHGAAPPHVHVSAEDLGREWRFSIKDNGIGIEPQYADRIFEIFQRLHTRDEYPGTGIGLAVCRRIVERHGGRIWFESEPGRGTAFHFTVPK